MFFYLRYSLKNIVRGGRWAALAIFCIAAGVATVVALRGLGLAIGDSLIENVRIDNKGDFRIVKGNVSQFAAFFQNDERFFTQPELGNFQRWVDTLGGRMTAFSNENRQIAPINAQTFGRPTFISTFYIDPTTYPPNYDIIASDPAGIPLRQLFTGGNELVISQNMADTQSIKVGDQVRVSGTEQVFIVRGIVPTTNEGGIRNIFASFFGFAYMDIDIARATIRETINPNNLSIALNVQLNTEAEYDALAEQLFGIVDENYGWARIDTAFDLLRRNQQISDVTGNFIVLLGLGALLIGGVGIMNTMLVMVRRRTAEISALKTFGLKGNQIGWLFFTEGLLLGFIGSVLGCVLGIVLGGIVNQYGEAFLQQNLAWRVYPQALLFGFVLGILTSTIFSLAPIMSALQVRPVMILRPNDSIVPRLGCLQILFLMVFITIALGLIVGQIVTPTFSIVESTSRLGQRLIDPTTPYLLGVLGVATTLAILGILVFFLWWVVFFIGKFPSFGNVKLRLALRNLSNQRVRTATTLLALSAGMFTLSVITFVGEGTRELLTVQLTRQTGGNVLSFPLVPSRLASVGEFAVNTATLNVPGIRSRTIIRGYENSLRSIDDVPIEDVVGTSTDLDVLRFLLGGFIERDSTNPQFYDNAIGIVAGRNLTSEDRNRRVLIVPSDAANRLGISVGSYLLYNVNGQLIYFEVVGLSGAEGSGGILGTGGVYVPPGALGGKLPFFTMYSFDVEPEHLNSVLVALSSISLPPTYSVDTAFIDSLVSRLIAQFASIPTIVGILSLASAGVIMANTVALAVLERRRQIGILKAIGLKGGSVFTILVIETTIITVLSALLGMALSGLFLVIISALSATPVPLPWRGQLLVILLIFVALIIGWVSTLLSANVAIKERVMNVLRWE
jgi:putative ABC transport system permease protein